MLLQKLNNETNKLENIVFREINFVNSFRIKPGWLCVEGFLRYIGISMSIPIIMKLLVYCIYLHS